MKSKLLFVFPLALASAMLLATSGAQAQVFTASLSGPNEDPVNNSPGIGFATVTLNLALHTLEIDVSFSGLEGTTTAAHIHAPTLNPLTGTAGVATQTPYFVDFPIGVSSGSYNHIFNTLDTATYNGSYVTANGGTAAGAEAALAAALADGKAYFNIHSNEFPGGEIRGFLVPEPATIGLVALGAVGLLLLRRRRG